MDFALFLGRFHPLVVHLPIGFLFFAIVLSTWAWLKPEKAADFRIAVNMSLWLGAGSAAMACLLGYLLSFEGGYEAGLLNQHLWAGILTTLVAGLAAWLHQKKMAISYLPQLKGVGLALIFLGVSWTGHLGGSLTHGSQYLTEYAPFGPKEPVEPMPTQMAEVKVYSHLVAQTLEAKCVSCHGPSKRKGGLSLSTPQAIEEGGENGAPWIAGAPEKSLLVKRINLPRAHKEAMPPKGKTQLSESEKALLSWWIAQGADLDQNLDPEEAPKSVLTLASQLLDLESTESRDQMIASLDPVDSSVFVTLETKGFQIRELVHGSHRLDVSFSALGLNDGYSKADMLTDLQQIAGNVQWLNLAALGLSDQDLKSLEQMPQLEKLRLEKNQITSAGLQYLKPLPRLRVLNLYGNPVDPEALPILAEISSLEKVYGWQSELRQMDSLSFQLIL